MEFVLRGAFWLERDSGLTRWVAQNLPSFQFVLAECFSDISVGCRWTGPVGLRLREARSLLLTVAVCELLISSLLPSLWLLALCAGDEAACVCRVLSPAQLSQ